MVAFPTVVPVILRATVGLVRGYPHVAVLDNPPCGGPATALLVLLTLLTLLATVGLSPFRGFVCNNKSGTVNAAFSMVVTP